jgi:hypothetical protein
MPRYRLIPTGVPASTDLRKTLGDMGLHNVEVHASPSPLQDWIGRPTDVMADVIVRRKDLGASSDDLGFLRNPDGTWGALVSEIHLFRFDKHWFADLAKRSGVAVPAASPRQFADSTSSPVAGPSASATAAAKAREAAPQERARVEAAEMLDHARRTQRLGRIGCLLYFVPLVPWLLMGVAQGRLPASGPLLVLWVLWTFVYLFALVVVFALRFQARVREFATRFPKGSEARAAAIGQLRAVADDKTNQARAVAERLLANVEKDVTIRLTQRRSTPRGPGASGQ